VAQHPDVTTEPPPFRPRSELEETLPPLNEIQLEESFQDYTKQVEGMLGKYMMTFVQHLMKQKWGEVHDEASPLPFSNAESSRDARGGAAGTLCLSHPAISAQGDLHASSSAPKALPDFWYLINPDNGASSSLLPHANTTRDVQGESMGMSGLSSLALVSNEGNSHLSSYHQTTGALDNRDIVRNVGEMGLGGSSRFSNRMSGSHPSTTMGRLPLVNEGSQDVQQGYSQTLWPTTSQIIQDVKMYPQF
jgi:hypothetical protein